MKGLTAQAVITLFNPPKRLTMTGKTPGPWNKPSIKLSNKNDDSSFPGLKPTTPDATSKIEYDELQQNELIVLEAMYGEDFVKHTQTQSAWKVRIFLTCLTPCLTRVSYQADSWIEN